MKNFISCFAKYDQNGEVKEDEIGRACRASGEEEECV
jgi:hypothetical protein